MFLGINEIAHIVVDLLSNELTEPNSHTAMTKKLDSSTEKSATL